MGPRFVCEICGNWVEKYGSIAIEGHEVSGLGGVRFSCWRVFPSNLGLSRAGSGAGSQDTCGSSFFNGSTGMGPTLDLLWSDLTRHADSMWRAPLSDAAPGQYGSHQVSRPSSYLILSTPPPIQSTPAPSPLPLLSLPPSRPFFYWLPLSSCTDDRDAIGENEGFFSVNSTETFLFSTLISFFFKKRRLWTESSRVDRERAIRRQL